MEITTGFAPMDFTVILPKKYIEYPPFIPTDDFYTKRREDLFLLKHKNGQFRRRIEKRPLWSNYL
jgi:hypothetical protein